MVRYLANGQPDSTFGTNGKASTQLLSSGYGLAVTDDNRIIVAGQTNYPPYRVTLVKFLENGSLDPSFGTNGGVETSAGPNDNAGGSTVMLQPDGKILVGGGASHESGAFGMLAMRYFPTGMLDTDFGSQGVSIAPFGSFIGAETHAMGVDSKGRIVLAGRAATITSGTTTSWFALARFNQVAPTALAISPSSLTLPATSSTGGLSLAANISWTATSDQPWLAVTPDTGAANAAIAIAASANPSMTARTATVAVSGGGMIREVTITQEGSTIQPLSPPAGLSASDGSFPDKIRLTWSDVAGAVGYVVSRNTSNSIAGSTEYSIVQTTTFDDATALPGVTYFYWVRAWSALAGYSAASFSDSGHRPNVVEAVYSGSADIPVTAAHYNAAGGTINFGLLFAPPTGSRLMVINNTGLSFIQGNFSNLEHGQQMALIFNGVTYRFVANYYGGDGNDLELHWAETKAATWGDNEYGQLGNATILNNSLPSEVSVIGPLAGKTVLSLAAGAAHNLALCSDGMLVAWGRNDSGQLGIGNTTSSTVPVPVDVSGVLAGKSVVAIAAGQDHSVCLCSDGTLFAWGKNYNGQLGNNSTADSSVPVQVDISGALAGKLVTRIAAGGFHNLALCSDGTTVSWGWNDNGQLGDNSTTQRLAPVAISGLGALATKSVVALSAGWYHSVALCSDGSMASWGANAQGQLGTQTAVDGLAPQAVVTSGVLSGRAVKAIAAGGNHCLALCTDGTLTSWGYNFDGELGNDSTTNSTVPVAVNTSGVLVGRSVAAISAGLYHSTAWCSDGTLAAWGRNNQGQLGNGVVSLNSLVPVQTDASALALGSRFVGTTGKQGYFHGLSLVAQPPPLPPAVTLLAPSSITGTSALLNARVNANGGLTQVFFDFGEGVIYDQSVTANPSTINGSSDSVISTSITGLLPGASYICRVVAVSEAGTTSSTGQIFSTLSNNARLVGLTAGGAMFTPAFSSVINDYSISVPNSTSFLPISPTAADANALIEVNGVQVASGASSGMIGLPVGSSTVTVRVTSPDSSTIKDYSLNITRAPLSAQFFSESDVPVTTSRYIASGSLSAPTLHFGPAAGTVLTIVNNTGPRLIQGIFDNLAQGQSLAISNGGLTYRFVANYFGGDGNDLVLQWADTKIYAWGDNESGQLGTSSLTSSPVPTPVYRSGVLLGKTVISVVAGKRHNLALCSDGKLVAWGKNIYGQLGNDTVTDSSQPVAVSTSGVLAGKHVVSMATGEKHSLAVCSDGTLVAWGNNAYGQLGDGSTTGSLTAIAVTTAGALNGKTVVSVAAGAGHSLALCSDGTLVAWGWNDYGELGVNSTENTVSNPTLVDTSGALTGKEVISISASNSHSLALCSDGTVVAWGRNNNGQLGNTTTVDSRVPVLVSTASALSGKTVIKIAAGQFHSLATCSDGTVAAWGWNEFGQIGDNSVINRLVPVSVSTTSAIQGKFVLQASGGHAHSQALCSDGSLVAWGWNSWGQIGDNGTTNRQFPVDVNTQMLTPGERFMRGTIGQGDYHSIGLVAGPPLPSTQQETWRQSHFGVADNNGAAADLTDYDQDGLVNLLEYAFDLNPTQNSSGQVPQGQMDGANFAISFTQPPGVTSIIYGAEWSTTMIPNDWHSIPDTGTPPQHTFSVPIGGNTNLFMRLKVTSP